MVGISFWGVPAAESHDTERTGECVPGYPQGISGNVCPTEAPHKAFLRLPTSCPDHPLEWVLEADSYIHPGVLRPRSPTRPRRPSAATSSNSPRQSKRGRRRTWPRPHRLRIQPPPSAERRPDGLAEANLRATVVHLPEGMTANPGLGTGLDACSSAEIGLTTPIGRHPPASTSQPPHCPDASKLGPVEIESPLLENPLKGAAYLAEPYDNPYESFLTLYIVVEDRERGVVVKLPARIEPDPQTGQIAAILEDAPQLPFEDFKMRLDAGPHAALKTPGDCGSHTALRVVDALDRSRRADGENGGQLRHRAGGQRIALQQRRTRRSPGFTAGTRNPRAGAYTPFTLKAVRGDGTQADPLDRHDAAARPARTRLLRVLLLGGGARRGRRTSPVAPSRPRRAVPPPRGWAASTSAPGSARARTTRRGRIPRRPVQRRAAEHRGRHPGGGRAIRPRHGRRPRGALRRPGHDPDPGGQRPDPVDPRTESRSTSGRSGSTWTVRTSPRIRPPATRCPSSA